MKGLNRNSELGIMETNTNNTWEGFRLLITGAGSGIGLATATLAKNRGALVSGVVQDREQADVLAAVTGKEGVFDADVTDAARMSETVEQARKRMGGLDGLAACAGIFQHLGGLESSVEEWQQVISVNLSGSYHAARAAARHMAAEGRGSIVLVSSQIGIVGHPRGAAYSASKAGINGLTKALALELAARQVRVNAVAPGPIATPMTAQARADPERSAKLLAGIPLARFGEAEEVAEAILFLLSGASSFITGHILLVDGGFTAQ